MIQPKSRKHLSDCIQSDMSNISCGSWNGDTLLICPTWHNLIVCLSIKNHENSFYLFLFLLQRIKELITCSLGPKSQVPSIDLGILNILPEYFRRDDLNI